MTRLYQSGVFGFALFVTVVCIDGTMAAQSGSMAAQDQSNLRRIDSLRVLIGQSQPDTSRVFLLLEVSAGLHAAYSFQAMSDQPQTQMMDSILGPALRGLKLAERIGFLKGQVYVHRFYGSLHEELLFDYPAALMHFQKALRVARSANLYPETHNVLGCLLNVYFHLGDFSSAMSASAEGLKLAEEKRDKKNIAKYKALYGFIHLRQNNANEALEYYDQYRRHAEELHDSSLIADAFNCLGEAHVEKRDLKKALALFHQALDFYQRKNKRAMETGSGTAYLDRIPFTLFKIAMAYRASGDYELAMKYCALVQERTTAPCCNDYDLATYYLNIGNIFSEQGDFSKAEVLLRNGLSISRKIRHAENARDGYRYLASLFSRQDRFDSAYHYLSLYGLLRDSISNAKVRQEIARVHSIYNIQKKDEEIERQKQEHKAAMERQQFIQIGFICLLLCLGIMGYLLYNRFKLKQKHDLHLLLNQKQNELLHSVMAAQDKERKRIAQDLHDSLGSMLAAAKLKLSDIDIGKTRLDTHEKENFRTTVALLDEAVTELRNVSHNIMPATLSKIGLIAALKNMFERISSNGSVRINYITHGFDTRLQEETEMTLYRILLELVSNVIRHAKAEEVTVQLIRYPTHINVTVEDDGIGFDEATSRLDAGIGIGNILSRVDYLRGTVDIDSSLGKGTSIIINIPAA